MAKIPRFSQWSMRTKLTCAFLIVGLLPLLLFAFGSAVTSERALQRQTAVEMHARAAAFRAALASDEGTVLDDIRNTAEWNDFCAAMDEGNAAWLRNNVTTWMTQNTALDGAQALTTGGKVVSASGAFRGLSLADNPVVAASRRTRADVVDLQLIGGRLYLIGAGPVVEENVADSPVHGLVVFGSVVNRARLVKLASFIGASELDLYSGSRLVASSTGPAASSFPPGHPVGAAFTSGPDTLLLSQLRDHAGRPQALLGLRVRNAAVAVTGSTLRRTAAYALAIGLLVALAASLVVAGLLIRPLRLLTQAARAMAAGETRQHVPVTGGDELGEVATAFNVMSDRLAAAFGELERRSDTDELTGLLNYRATMRALDAEAARGRRYAVGFSLLVLDIDDFKLLNDTHGHPAGDAVLRQMSRQLQSQTRESDLVGRQGGDEFMVILPETRSEEAAIVAEKLRAAVAEQPYVTLDGRRVPLRVSIGLASFPEDGSEVDQLLAKADANLYASKRRGGNAATRGRDGEGWDDPAGAFGMLESLVTAVDNKDNYTYRHSREVTEHALRLAAALALSEQSQRIVRVAGLLHDVGKIGVPDAILRKPGGLRPDEQQIARQHPLLGALIIQRIPDCEEVREAVVSHHERWDGRGYPHALRGEAIPLLGRILAVADAYSAMTSDRPYRKGLTSDEAAAELRRCAGTQFDPALVEPFLASLGREAMDTAGAGRPQSAPVAAV